MFVQSSSALASDHLSINNASQKSQKSIFMFIGREIIDYLYN